MSPHLRNAALGGGVTRHLLPPIYLPEQANFYTVINQTEKYNKLWEKTTDIYIFRRKITLRRSFIETTRECVKKNEKNFDLFQENYPETRRDYERRENRNKFTNTT